MDSFGAKLYELRKTKGLFQEALADLVAVSRQTVYKWENDKVQPSYKNLIMLCDKLSVDQEYFYERKVMICFSIIIFLLFFILSN